MRKFRLFGGDFVVSDALEEYSCWQRRLNEIANREAEAARERFSASWVAKCMAGEDPLRGVWESSADLSRILEPVVDLLMVELKEAHCYELDREKVAGKYLRYSAVAGWFIETRRKMEVAVGRYVDTELIREDRVERAGNYWQGGGLGGMGVAFKGVIKAEISNRVQAGIAALFNRVERKSDIKKLRKELEEILQKRISSLPDAVANTVMGQIGGVVSCLRECCGKEMRITCDRNKAKILYRNLLGGLVQKMDLPDVKRRIVENDPWMGEAYNHFYEEEGANRVEIETLAAFFDVSLNTAKARVLRRCVARPKFDSEDAVLQYRKELLDFSSTINYVPREELREIDAIANEYARNRVNEKAKIKAMENQRRIQREIAEREADEARRRSFGVVYSTSEEAQAAARSHEEFSAAILRTIASHMKKDVGIVWGSDVDDGDAEKIRRTHGLSAETKILAFIDTTFWSSRKKGLAITSKGLSWKNDAGSGSFSWNQWRGIDKVPQVGQNKESRDHVYVTNADYIDLGSCSCVDAERLANILAILQGFAKEAEFEF